MMNTIPYPPRQSFDIQDREDGIATTALTNEHAAALRALQPFIQTGQVPDHPYGGSAEESVGEFQWQHKLMPSANQAGWDDPRWTAILED